MNAPPASEESKQAFLREVGAGEVDHTRRSLLDHLVATRDLLKSWGASESLCDAALFHSVYGTRELSRRLPAPIVVRRDRDRVRALIGDEAERIAWLFGAIDPRPFVSWAGRGETGAVPLRRGRKPVDLSPEDVAAIANLIVANAVEQLPRRHRGHRKRTRAMFRMRAHLLPAAIAALERERSWRRRLFG